MLFLFIMSKLNLMLEMNNINYFINFIFFNMKYTEFIILLIMIYYSIYFFSFYYMSNNKNYLFFMLMLFLFFISMIILITSKSIFSIFLGWDGLGITSFMLVFFYKNWITLNNSLLTFLSNRLGDSLLILFFSAMLFKMKYSGGIFMLMMLISFTKSAQFPFMSWLPAAMAAPTPVSALVHSSTLVTAGVFIYLLLMNYTSIFGLKFIYFFCNLTMIIAGVGASLENDFKKMVAYSTLSQIGLLFMMMAFFKVYILFFHLFSHAFFKSMLFLSVGGILHESMNCQETRSLNKNMNMICNLFMKMSIFNLAGLFFLSGFWTKDLFIFNNFYYINNLGGLFLFFTIISLTLIYSMKMLLMTFMFNKIIYFKEKSYLFYCSIILLFIMSLIFSIFINENYYFLCENFAFNFFNFLIYILFLMIYIFMNNKMKNMFMFMGGLYNYNKMMSKNYFNSMKMIEKMMIEKMMNYNLLYFFNNKYYFLMFLLFILLFL